ncbi:MAG: DUF4116 domain-containing protein [Bacilli bacterium]|nr:DUF4116 domain-containing protein [Bacilli bacterium]
MNKFDNLSKEQFLMIFETLKKEGLAEFLSMFEDDINSIIKLVVISPLSYNLLSLELKKNKSIIENAYKSFVKNKIAGIDFYSVIENSDNKVKAFQEIFGNLSCSEGILKILIIDEYCADRTTELLDEYKVLVIADDNLLNDILCICGFVGFLNVLKNDSDFILRMVKINGDCLLLASDRLKKDRTLILEAVKNKPMVAFELGLSEDDPILKTAVEIIRSNAHRYIELPCLDIN